MILHFTSLVSTWLLFTLLKNSFSSFIYRNPSPFGPAGIVFLSKLNKERNEKRKNKGEKKEVSEG